MVAHCLPVGLIDVIRLKSFVCSFGLENGPDRLLGGVWGGDRDHVLLGFWGGARAGALFYQITPPYHLSFDRAAGSLAWSASSPVRGAGLSLSRRQLRSLLVMRRIFPMTFDNLAFKRHA